MGVEVIDEDEGIRIRSQRDKLKGCSCQNYHIQDLTDMQVSIYRSYGRSLGENQHIETA